MFKPSEVLRPSRLVAMSGIALLTAAALMLPLPFEVSAGVSPGGKIEATAKTPVPTLQAPPATAAPTAKGGPYRLRCWQYGRLLFDEGPVTLGADARQAARMVATDRNGAALLVTEVGGATCLARPTAPPPSLALPH